MAQEIVLPQWGMEMQDATVVRWLKQEGDPVQEGEPLVELETAKIATELESIASGVVAHILIPEGATVPIRTVLAIVTAPGEQVARPAGAAPSGTAARATAPAASSRSAAPVAPQVVPAARRLAQERGIDLAQVQGTGPGGRILVEDVQKVLEARIPAAPVPCTVLRSIPCCRARCRAAGVTWTATSAGAGYWPQGQNPH